MPQHYFWRKDLSKYTLKSFASANEAVCDKNNSDLLTYDANGTTKVVVDTTSTQTLSGKTLTSPIINGGSKLANVISGNAIQTAGAATLTTAQSGSTILFDLSSGITLTLPPPSVGLDYSFFVEISASTGNYKIITDTGTTLLLGTISSATEATTPGANPGPKNFSANGTTHVACTMNGSTSGGVAGTYLKLTCITSTLWMVTGLLEASGTIITPFATS